MDCLFSGVKRVNKQPPEAAPAAKGERDEKDEADVEEAGHEELGAPASTVNSGGAGSTGGTAGASDTHVPRVLWDENFRQYMNHMPGIADISDFQLFTQASVCWEHGSALWGGACAEDVPWGPGIGKGRGLGRASGHWDWLPSSGCGVLCRIQGGQPVRIQDPPPPCDSFNASLTNDTDSDFSACTSKTDSRAFSDTDFYSSCPCSTECSGCEQLALLLFSTPLVCILPSL